MLVISLGFNAFLLMLLLLGYLDKKPTEKYIQQQREEIERLTLELIEERKRHEKV